ncbi:hypothetical protein F5B19DRAFT_366365 [Rostrohypoxylon terebratum]|nr:hypothetical protein F5B19DRAFT_366365 [Rostrohypoxylon terebratum]
MQIIKPLFAFFCAQLAFASPIANDELPAVGLVERTAPAPDATVQKWNKLPGVPSGGLTTGFSIFSAQWPRDKSKDVGLPDIVVNARDFIGSNHWVLVAVEIKEKTTGPPKKRVTNLVVNDVKFWDLSIDGDKSALHSSGREYKLDQALADKVTHSYIKKLGSSATISKITDAAKEYVKENPTYNAEKVNCKTFVQGVAAELK